MKISREVQKTRGERLKAVLDRYNLKPSDIANFKKSDIEARPIKIEPSEVTTWIKGGYGEEGKGYLTETKALDIISVIRDKFPDIPEIRLSYLLGIDSYMTDYDWAEEYYKIKDIVADSMWAIIEKSLKRQNKHLCFIHRKDQHIDSTERLNADCFYTITDTEGKVLKKLSALDMIRFEEKIQDCCDFLTEKYL
jgi:hypothetical protein